MDHLTLIHGILTKKTPPAWPWVFEAWMDKNLPEVSATSNYYAAGPFPPYNIWYTNPKEARTLASYINLRKPAGDEPFNHSIVAHSNGTCIAVDLARQLAAEGTKTERLILIGSALHSDVDRSGLSELVDEGFVKQVIAYGSPDDTVVKRLQWFPGFYGSLGSRGLERNGHKIGLQLNGYEDGAPLDFSYDNSLYINRTFRGWSHAQWWTLYNEEETFKCIAKDLRLTK